MYSLEELFLDRRFLLILMVILTIVILILILWRSLKKANQDRSISNTQISSNYKNNMNTFNSSNSTTDNLSSQLHAKPIYTDTESLKKSELDVQVHNEPQYHTMFFNDQELAYQTSEQSSYKACPKCGNVVKSEADTCFMCGNKF